MTRRGVDTAHEGESLIDVVAGNLYGNFAIMTTEEAHDFAVIAVEATIEALAAEAEEHTDDYAVMDNRTNTLYETTADWLRSLLDAGRDGEAGRKA